METLRTKWGRNLKPDNVLLEYPRPQLVRDSYLNLNGYWDLIITDDHSNNKVFEGKILVPFSPEAVLSGVNHVTKPNETLHYRRNVNLPVGFHRGRLIIHFGAVDQIAEVYINDQYIATHIGGFTPFSLDITDYVKTDSFDVLVKVKDYSDNSYHSIGKQRFKRGGIFYSVQSGIWQTVWLESVPQNYLKNLYITPLYDEQSVKFTLDKTNEEEVYVEVSFKGVKQGEIITADKEFIVKLNNLYPWSPEKPNLYDVKITYGEDIVHSYFGMRVFEKRQDKDGLYRFYLNHKPYLLTGVLDQGYYSDGLLTPPSDKAMIEDINLMKKMGFNLLRKHIKIEPLRWYYHCDRLGIIVFQDMINGGNRKDILFHSILALIGIHLPDRLYFLFGRKDQAGRNEYKQELTEMINHLYNTPCIATWVPFNEAWGQFDSKVITEYLKSLDNTRLIDHASGWSDQGIGDYHSRHIYFTPIRFFKSKGIKRINALTEFGGYSLVIEGHLFNKEKVFGYKVFKTKDELAKALETLYLKKVLPQITKGLSVIIYTQLSDVEDEVNGLITYDREVVKVDIEKMKYLNNQLKLAFGRVE